MNGFSQNFISYTKSAVKGAKELKTLSLSKLRKVFSLLGKREKIALGVLLAVAIFSFVVSVQNFYYAITVPAATYGGSYTEGLLGQPVYINPLLASQDPDLSLTNLVFSGLYKYGDKGQLVPDLANGMPTISEDQKQYSVNLKQNATWHNNKPVTADDVVFTIQTLQDPNFKSPLRPLWQATAIEKLSDYSVKFTTKNVSVPFLNSLTLPILPKSVWSNVGSQKFLLSQYNQEAIGSGPYSIKEIKKLPSGKVEQITLASFPGYFGDRAKIDELVIKFYDTEDDILNAFHSREIEGFGFVPLGSSLFVDKNQNQAQVLSVPLPQYQVVFFNLNNKILADQNVRTALSLATDKHQIIDQVFKGNALLPVSPLVFNDPQNPQTIPSVVDITKAKNLLESSGWAIDPKTNLRTKKGQVFKISIATNDSIVNAQAAEVLANQWKALDVQVNLTVLPSKQLTDTLIKPRGFDVLLFPQKFGADPDPFLFWHSSQIKDPGFNLTGFSDPAADKLIVEARSTTNREARAQKYVEFNNLIMSKVPIIFLDQTEFVYTVDNSIKNIKLNFLYDPSQRFSNINTWYIAEKRVWK
ncbi:MAG TPA: peptide ABC transporter substrate-binding protein [Candidatus Limnocylindria bacterium]|nr:peptide ABC transporter substrate-binding protein [Candidatus Limnocylindria bacterium]